MKNIITRFPLVALVCGVVSLSSCKKDIDSQPIQPSGIQPYEVPATYTFAGVDYTNATNRVQMAVELNTYLGTAGTAILDQAKADNLFNNTASPFATAALNTSGVNLLEKTADASVY